MADINSLSITCISIVVFDIISMNDIENLMPSCRMCNYYKGAGGVEFLRKELKHVIKHLTKPFLNRFAMSYGMMELKEWDGKFYYENPKTI